MRRAVVVVSSLVVMCGLIATTLPVEAASGLAWDQVTKFSMDGSIPDPNFAQDFQTASQPPQQQQQSHGMFAGLNNAMSAAMGAMQMMKSGIAERHFVAGNLRRTDNVGQQTATITDCGARTITYLDLGKKTYRVVSMDQPQVPTKSSGRPNSSERPTPVQDDGTTYKIAYTAQALGVKQVSGVNTDGYKANMNVTMTKPSGESHTFNTTVTEYLSGYGEPKQSCPSAFLGMGGPGGSTGPMAAMSSNMNMTRMLGAAMRTPGGDPRFTFTSSGPQLPSGKLDMFSVWQMSGEQQSQGRGGFATIVERGNVHQISDTDQSIFGVPADFTKET